MQEANVTEEESEAAKNNQGREGFEDKEENEDEETIEEEDSSDEDEDTSTEESSDEGGQDTSEKPDNASKDLEKKNKELFARAKKAEDKLKKFEGKKDAKKGDSQIASADPIELAKTIAALKDFSSDELDYVQLIAKGKGLDLNEAVETDEVKTYIGAKREKAEGENKTPDPSSPSSVIGGKTGGDIQKMKKKEFAKFIKNEMKGSRTGI